MTDIQIFLHDRVGVAEQPLAGKKYVTVKEFSGWLVRETVRSEHGLFILWGNAYLPLDWSDELIGYLWPKGRGKYKKDIERSRTTSGLLDFYHLNPDGSYSKLNPSVYILAESISEADLGLLLDRLGELAISDRSAVLAPVASHLPVGVAQNGILATSFLLRKALAVLEFYKQLEQQWSVIEAMPAMTARPVLRKVRNTHPLTTRSAIALRQMVTHIGQSHLIVPALEESPFTPENAFVGLALRTLESQADSLRHALQQEADRLRKDRISLPPDVDVTARGLWNQGRATARGAAAYLDEIAESLERAAEWSCNRQSAHIIPRRIEPLLNLHQPSLRLTRSAGYGSLYSSYKRTFNVKDYEITLDAVRRGLVEKTVKTTHELYEVWVFLETYALLVERFGFRPVDDEPLAHLSLQNGEIHLQSEQQFYLELRLENEPEGLPYKLHIAYEPKIDYPSCGSGKAKCFIPSVCPALPCYRPKGANLVTPDVVLIFEHGASKFRFALDAKYRRYDAQPLDDEEVEQLKVQSLFEADVLITAKQRYLDGIQFDAAFIVHSDPSGQYIFFGGTDHPSLRPHREISAGLPLCPNHRYGAIYAVPKRTLELEKLIKCFLMYHAGWYDICWECRRRLTVESGERYPSPKSVATYFQCQFGHGFWAKSHCNNKLVHHTLIKMGEESFHTTRRDVWNCVCPKCGSAL